MSKIVPLQPTKMTSPTAETGTVPNRKRNDELRNGRKYLTPLRALKLLRKAVTAPETH